MPLESNPNNLPLDIALAIEQRAGQATPAKSEEAHDAANLVERLLAIRERLFWLQAVWATTLSPDIAWEADRWRERFRSLADELRKHDAEALDRIVAGYESLLLAEPMRKPTIPLATQQLFELACEVRSERSQPAQPKPQGYVPDGLQRFI